MKDRIVVFVLAFLIYASAANALENINLRIQPEFSTGENIIFYYAITADADKEIEYSASVLCPNAPMPLHETRTAELKANILFEGNYTYGKVQDFFEPGSCTAYVQISAPFRQRAEKNFTISTNPSLEFSVNICKDSACSEKSKTFIKNENIYLGYDSVVSGAAITASLTYPDRNVQLISLPSSIRAEQIGTYTLEATASKEGYKTVSRREQFAVIENAIQIQSVSVCNANSVCDGDENSQNCPQDCPLAKWSKVVKLWALVAGIFSILVIIAHFVIKRHAEKY